MTTDQPLVSIITPVYNGSKYIEKLIESVCNQDYPNIEHIVIDDGSTDDGATVAILKRYSHLRWWTRENKGQYATMNEGLAAARGDVICFISADDVIAPGAVRVAVNTLSAHPECAGVYGKFRYVDEKGEPYPVQPFIDSGPLSFFPYFGFVSHCVLYLRKQLILEKELWFDVGLRYTGDYDWIIRLIRAGMKILYVPVVCAQVRMHKEQTSIRHQDSAKKEHELVFKRHKVNRFLFHSVEMIQTFRSVFLQLQQELKNGGSKKASVKLYLMISKRIKPLLKSR